MKPEIKESIGGYEFTWADSDLVIAVSRVVTHRDRVNGELKITTTRKDFLPSLYPPTQFNFSADRTRRDLIRGLKEQYPDWDWSTILNQLCDKVQELARAGEPVKELWTSEDVPKPEYLLEPILVKGIPTVIFGEKGVTKSTLSLVLDACLLLPWVDNPLEIKVPERSVKTLILDWETEDNIIQSNASELQRGMGLPPFPIYYRRCALRLSDDIEQIQRHIGETGAEVVIIDSLGAAAGGELKDAQSAIDFFTALRRLKVTSLILAQTSKSEDSPKKTIYGSNFFTYYARSIFELCRSDDREEDNINVALFHRWSNLGKLVKPMGFSFSFNGVGTKVERQAVTVAEFRNKVSVSAKILDALKAGVMSTKDLVEVCDISRGDADTATSRLKKSGKIQKLNDGAWGLSQ